MREEVSFKKILEIEQSMPEYMLFCPTIRVLGTERAEHMIKEIVGIEEDMKLTFLDHTDEYAFGIQKPLTPSQIHELKSYFVVYQRL